MTDWLAEAKALHADTIVVDGHADTPQRFVDEGWDWTSPELKGGHLSAATAKEGLLDAEFFALWTEPTQWNGRHVERTLSLLEGIEAQLHRHPAQIRLCTASAEVRRAKADGVFAALLGIEGGHSIANDLDLLREFYRRGVRYMTLTWSNTNDWCDSSGDVERHGGLTPFGCEVVAEMNRLGMMVDLSHVSDTAFWKALATSSAPVIASHSSARSLTNSHRNLTDEMLRSVADHGGVVMVNFYAAFISEPYRLAWNGLHDERAVAEAALMAPYRERNEPLPYREELRLAQTFQTRLQRPALSDLLDHIEHVLRVCGTAHVGLGSDFDGIPLAPAGVDTAADMPRITAGLLERGWQPEDLRGLLGGNILRVLDRVQSLAGSERGQGAVS